jgi:hypothetical protein
VQLDTIETLKIGDMAPERAVLAACGFQSAKVCREEPKGGLEDQGVIKTFKGRTVDFLLFPGPPGLLSGSFLGSLEFFSGIYC